MVNLLEVPWVEGYRLPVAVAVELVAKLAESSEEHLDRVGVVEHQAFPPIVWADMRAK